MSRTGVVSIAKTWAICLYLFSMIGCRHGIIIKAPVGAPASIDPNTHKEVFEASSIDPGQYTVSDYLKQKQAYEAAVETGGGQLAQAKAMRNDIVYGIMTQIEILYSRRYAQLFGGKNSVAVAGDGVVLGLSAASTIATHTATKTILSALGTAFSGVVLSVDKNYYSQQSFQIIGIAMQTRRDKIRAVIVENLSKDVTSYPLNAARRDLITYLQAGTLASGLQELQEEAGAATAKQALTAGTSAPSVPSGVVVNPGVTDAVVSWTPVSTATSYNVYYSTTKGVSKTASKVTGLTAPVATITGLNAAGAYYFAVSAVNSAGESDLSSEVATTLQAATSVVPATGIAAPTNPRAIRLGSSVSIFWDAVPGADHYIVNRVIRSGANVVSDNAIDAIVKENRYLDSLAGLTTSPAYTVQAVDASGNKSAESSIADPVALTIPGGLSSILQTPH